MVTNIRTTLKWYYRASLHNHRTFRTRLIYFLTIYSRVIQYLSYFLGLINKSTILCLETPCFELKGTLMLKPGRNVHSWRIVLIYTVFPSHIKKLSALASASLVWFIHTGYSKQRILCVSSITSCRCYMIIFCRNFHGLRSRYKSSPLQCVIYASPHQFCDLRWNPHSNCSQHCPSTRLLLLKPSKYDSYRTYYSFHVRLSTYLRHTSGVLRHFPTANPSNTVTR